MSLSEFRAKYPQHFGANRSSGPVAQSLREHIKIDISAKHDKSLRRWNRFLCADLAHGEHESATRAGGVAFYRERFVYVWTNQYFLPALFSNPHHSQQLVRWFGVDRSSARTPARVHRVYPTLLKLVVLPSCAVLDRVRKFLVANPQFRDPERYAGLQIRAFQVSAFGSMSRAFDQCQEHLISPRSADPKHFFLATMHPVVRSYFREKYRDRVAWMTESSDQLTGQGAGGEVGALADMFMLSISTTVLVSPQSTFGGFVGPFGEVDTRVVAWWVNGERPLSGSANETITALCPLQRSREPCFSSWFRLDRIYHRSNLAKTGLNTLSCSLHELPEDVMTC